MVNFTFLGYTFSYPEGAEKPAELFGSWMKKASNAENLFDTLYNEQEKEYFHFVDNLSDKANKMLRDELEEAIGYLFSNGINSSEEEFIAKYEDKFNFSYEIHIGPVLNELSKIESYAETLDRERAQKSKVFHGQWEGGGFGLGGALKGAIQAKVLNAIQNKVNSASESTQEKQDVKDIMSQMYTCIQTHDAKR